MSKKKAKKWIPLSLTDHQSSAPPDLQDVVKKLDDSDEVWGNGDYTVHVRRNVGGFARLVHLSIHDKHKTARHDWRDYQRIKNEICGPEEEAFEIYPAESRLVDTSNEFHLWCFVGVGIGVGYSSRLVSEDGIDTGAKQRLWPKANRPADLVFIDRKMLEDAAKKENDNGRIDDSG